MVTSTVNLPTPSVFSAQHKYSPRSSVRAICSGGTGQSSDVAFRLTGRVPSSRVLTSLLFGLRGSGPSDNTQLTPRREIAVEDLDRLFIRGCRRTRLARKALCAETDPGGLLPEKGGSTREARRYAWPVRFGSNA